MLLHHLHSISCQGTTTFCIYTLAKYIHHYIKQSIFLKDVRTQTILLSPSLDFPIFRNQNRNNGKRKEKKKKKVNKSIEIEPKLDQ